MTKWHGGKGSTKRPMNIDQEQFDKNFEAIFGKKRKKGEKKDANKTKGKSEDKK